MRGHRINISNLRSVYNVRFRVNSMEFDLRFNRETFENINVFDRRNTNLLFDIYDKCFKELINFLKNVLVIQPRDYVGIKFRLPSSNDGMPFGIPFVELRQISSTIITDLLQKLQQSNSKFSSYEKLEVVITVVERSELVGTRRLLKKENLANYERLIENKCASILVPKNEAAYDDDKCLARALVIGVEWEKCGRSRRKMRKLLVKSNSTLLQRKTDQLIRKTFGRDAVNVEREKFSLSDLIKFSQVLKGFQISVYNDVTLHKKVIFRSDKKCEKKINLFYFTQKEHCIALSNVKGFFGTKTYCEMCDLPHTNKSHNCVSKCASCYHSPKCIDKTKRKNVVFKIRCDECKRYFKNEKCLRQHHNRLYANDEFTVCERYRVCGDCFVFYDRVQLNDLYRGKKKKNHRCNEHYCFYCREFVTTSQHNCCVNVYLRKSVEKFVLIFFDLETVQRKKIEKKKCKNELKSLVEQENDLKNLSEGDDVTNRFYYKKNEEVETEFLHEAILVVCEIVCQFCWYKDRSETEVCDNCGRRTHVFEGKECVNQFITFVLDLRVPSEICCIAHNFRSFDGQLIMSSLLNIPNHDIQIIQNGYKILKLVVKNYITFLDSLSFLPMALSKFRETFDLDVEFEKQWCPYNYISFETWNEVGPIPPKDQFGVDLNDTENERVKAFEDWYKEKSTREYSIRDECIKYCKLDTIILKKGALKFFSIIRDIADINPFFECVTLAQLALTIYRKKFMKIGTLGIVPLNNYHLNMNQSKGCRKWLTYLNYFKSTETDVDYFIKPEVRIPLNRNVVVDGYCENYPFAKNKNAACHVFEYLGNYIFFIFKCNKACAVIVSFYSVLFSY